jgi:hypothetical protein
MRKQMNRQAKVGIGVLAAVVAGLLLTLGEADNDMCG